MTEPIRFDPILTMKTEATNFVFLSLDFLLVSSENSSLGLKQQLIRIPRLIASRQDEDQRGKVVILPDTNLTRQHLLFIPSIVSIPTDNSDSGEHKLHLFSSDIL